MASDRQRKERKTYKGVERETERSKVQKERQTRLGPEKMDLKRSKFDRKKV
jgi:hypothetical protein